MTSAGLVVGPRAPASAGRHVADENETTMIQLPRRSVTRFFIPLIDVLTLLFCIFLLLPLVQATDEDKGDKPGPDTGTASGVDPARLQQLERELAQLRRELEEERQRVDELRKEQVKLLPQRLAIQVLEINAANGKLYYNDPEPVEIANEIAARQLIARHRQQAAGRELYYLFLFPRRLTGYPEEWQVRNYERWFRDVPHGLDNPRAPGR